MTEGDAIRPAGPADQPAIETLYAAAFPQEDMLPVVRALSELAGVLSLVALRGGGIAGHVAFTPCALRGTAERLALLAPLAVTPALQRRGIGRALVSEGLARLRVAGLRRVLVLGSPAYYGRLGFGTEREVAPPYPLPAAWRDAWQSRELCAGPPLPPGTLIVPPPWQSRALWAP
ncbi:GNAT family N-acetyltransferase [Falsiroseomonas bella]|uniref:GNAT family N-acetyltransferase n=1 Tax=Falsiroseomonas bella TaxID=2184016 RepID=UPI0018EEAE60|nr:N-acetyltransferase [Falsiroseomonas bella]